MVLDNAGYGLMGPFETTSKDQIKREFDTNLFGVINVTRAFLPHFKQNKDGLYINVTSVGGFVAMPYLSMYHSTKFAVEGFSESLTYELEQFGIQVKIVEPGAVRTNFATTSIDIAADQSVKDYDADLQTMQQKAEEFMTANTSSSPEMIAETIYTAATDGSSQLRYLAGKDAEQFYMMKKEHGDAGFHTMMNQMILAKGV